MLHVEEFFISIGDDNAITVVFSSLQFDEYMFSRIVTLDLRPYPLVEEENEKQVDKKTG